MTRLVRLTFAGDLDHDNAPDLAPQFSAALAVVDAHGAEAGGVLVDMSAVEFVDSTGLGELVRLHHRAREAGVPGGVHAVIGDNQRMVRSAIALTGIDALITAHSDVSAALVALTTPPSEPR